MADPERRYVVHVTDEPEEFFDDMIAAQEHAASMEECLRQEALRCGEWPSDPCEISIYHLVERTELVPQDQSEEGRSYSDFARTYPEVQNG